MTAEAVEKIFLFLFKLQTKATPRKERKTIIFFLIKKDERYSQFYTIYQELVIFHEDPDQYIFKTYNYTWQESGNKLRIIDNTESCHTEL